MCVCLPACLSSVCLSIYLSVVLYSLISNNIFLPRFCQLKSCLVWNYLTSDAWSGVSTGQSNQETANSRAFAQHVHHFYLLTSITIGHKLSPCQFSIHSLLLLTSLFVWWSDHWPRQWWRWSCGSRSAQYLIARSSERKIIIAGFDDCERSIKLYFPIDVFDRAMIFVPYKNELAKERERDSPSTSIGQPTCSRVVN